MLAAALATVLSMQAAPQSAGAPAEAAQVALWATDRDARMRWWREARFGMFIHWGLYSPAGGSWDGKRYEQHHAEWIQHWAAVPCAEYARQGAAWGAGRLMADMRAAQPAILVNNRLFFGLENKNGDYGTPEKYVPPTGLPGIDWEVNHTLNESYGYSAYDMNWKDTRAVVRLDLEGPAEPMRSAPDGVRKTEP
jgi:hypothetical protein